MTGVASRVPVVWFAGADAGAADGEAAVLRLGRQGVPWQEAFDVVASVADFDQGVGELGFGVEAIEAAGCDQGVGAGPDAERIPGACEEGVSLG